MKYIICMIKNSIVIYMLISSSIAVGQKPPCCVDVHSSCAFSSVLHCSPVTSMPATVNGSTGRALSKGGKCGVRMTWKLMVPCGTAPAEPLHFRCM
jgi:hypothetical protein